MDTVTSPDTPSDLDAEATPSAIAAARALARLTRHLERSLTEASLTLPQYRLLSFLSTQPDAAHRLASKLNVRPPSLTALVDGLESRGLVARVADTDDRRRVRIVITDEGRSHLDVADLVAARRLAHIADLEAGGEQRLEGLESWHTALDEALRLRIER